MYSAELFNKKKLFLKFNNLRYSLLLINNKSKDLKIQARAIEYHNLATELLSRASFAYEILYKIDVINNLIIDEFNNIKHNLLLNTNRFIYESPLVRDFICLFMPFLNTLFILQDRIMPIIAYAAKIEYDLPSDAKKRRKFEKDLRKFPTYFYRKEVVLSKFPKSIQDIFLKYWKFNADLIRKYRNFDQHVSIGFRF